jgi:Uncharacterized protein conserved in bacteria (DUF2330)
MRARALLALCCWVAVASFSAPAAPCGAFVARASKTVPSLAVEQTLILFDPEQELEHFVRQIAIRDPSPGFGFVVPVPEKPVVAKVKEQPFARLAESFPVTRGLGFGGLRGGGLGGGMATAAAPVVVLSRARVGSFTAFVLAASDAKALQKWFSDNKLVVPPEAETWLSHYVKLGFYFAALRYEGPEKPEQSASTRAETIRISFKSTLPFYPYREPTHPQPNDAERDLAVWLISTRAYTPVSLLAQAVPSPAGGEAQWRRPLDERSSRQLVRDALGGVLSDELMKLLPPDARGAAHPLTIQVFEDQKRSRAGFGDIVMVPKQQTALTSLFLERSRKLMASLDPAVTP